MVIFCFIYTFLFGHKQGCSAVRDTGLALQPNSSVIKEVMDI